MSKSQNSLLNHSGFAMIGVIIAMSMIPALILASMSILDHVRYGNATERSLRTRNTLVAVQNWIIGQAIDIDRDNDTYYEPLKEGAGKPPTRPDRSSCVMHCTRSILPWGLPTICEPPSDCAHRKVSLPVW